MEKLQSGLEKVIRARFGVEIEVEVGQAPEGTGADYATNVAMKLAKVAHKSPMAIGEEIRDELEGEGTGEYEVSVAAPGFLNFRMCDEYFKEKVEALAAGEKVELDDYAGKMVGRSFLIRIRLKFCMSGIFILR